MKNLHPYDLKQEHQKVIVNPLGRIEQKKERIPRFLHLNLSLSPLSSLSINFIEKSQKERRCKVELTNTQFPHFTFLFLSHVGVVGPTLPPTSGAISLYLVSKLTHHDHHHLSLSLSHLFKSTSSQFNIQKNIIITTSHFTPGLFSLSNLSLSFPYLPHSLVSFSTHPSKPRYPKTRIKEKAVLVFQE